MARQVSFLGLGDTYLQVSGGGLEPIGSCSQLQFGVEEEEKSQPNYGRAGGLLASATRISAVNASLTMQNLSPANIARALRGTTAEKIGGTYSSEAHTVYPDTLLRLKDLDPTSITFDTVDGTAPSPALVADTDYQVTSAGLWLPAESAIFTAYSGSGGVPIELSYTGSDFNVVEALTGSGKEFYLVFDGLNEADSGRSCVIDAWRVKLGLPEALDVVGDDYITLALSGVVLADQSKGTGESAFFRWNYAKNAPA